jgi:hypothetical protein
MQRPLSFTQSLKGLNQVLQSLLKIVSFIEVFIFL